MTKRSAVVYCEGYYDRAFWKGWLEHLGLAPVTKTKERDPFDREVTGSGQFGFSSSQTFVRLVPCQGKDGILPAARTALEQLATRAHTHIVLNWDSDKVGSHEDGATFVNNTEALIKQVLQKAPTRSGNELKIDSTTVNIVVWSASDPPANGLPNQQTLERLACAALLEVHPTRGDQVHTWLASRSSPPPTGVKEFAWSQMAGWYPEQGTERFYSGLWDDPAVVIALERRLRAINAWTVGEAFK